jgi:amino acid permease
MALLFGFDLGYTGAWATYLALPLGIIPFSYAMSFWFTVDSAAQTFTMFFHFFMLGIMSTLTFGLRVAPD